MTELIKIRSCVEGDLETLIKNAKADEHSGVYFPTDVFVKGGEIVGYNSIGAVPMVLSWQHRKKMGPLDSALVLGNILGTTRQYKHICIPCDPDSPYHKSSFLTKAGFLEYSKPVILYIKE